MRSYLDHFCPYLNFCINFLSHQNFSKIERLISFLSEKSWPIGYTLNWISSRDEFKDLYGDNEQHLYDKLK